MVDKICVRSVLVLDGIITDVLSVLKRQTEVS